MSNTMAGEMPKIRVGRYEERDRSSYAGWVEPHDRSWILFVRNDGTPVLFPKRDPHTGAVIPEG